MVHMIRQGESVIYFVRIDLFRLYILFSQYRSCDDTQEI